MAESGKALVVGVALAAEVQFRLIADANEERAGSSGAYLVAPDRKRPVPMSKPCTVRRFVSDGGRNLFSSVKPPCTTSILVGSGSLSGRTVL
jgi:hypothetical protein